MLSGLRPGQSLLRREVHERYGGRRQGGIGPSSKVPAVLFFTDPATGQPHGYYDGMDDDGLYNYVGEGQFGDQKLVQGNKAILRHKDEGRSLEGFLARGTSVTYLGEFELVDFHFTETHESGNNVLRQAVVFRLRPLQGLPVDLPRVPVTPPKAPVSDLVPIEGLHTERAHVLPNTEPYEMERREGDLVQRCVQQLRREGHQVHRLRVVPPGESAPLFSDLWDQTTDELIEAKPSVGREYIRMAVGQLLDYRRFVKAKHLTVLVPARPRDDLREYLESVGIGWIYEDQGGWSRD